MKPAGHHEPQHPARFELRDQQAPKARAPADQTSREPAQPRRPALDNEHGNAIHTAAAHGEQHEPGSITTRCPCQLFGLASKRVRPPHPPIEKHLWPHLGISFRHHIAPTPNARRAAIPHETHDSAAPRATAQIHNRSPTIRARLKTTENTTPTAPTQNPPCAAAASTQTMKRLQR